MFDSREFIQGIVEENDPRAFRLPYKLCGSLTKRIMLNRYMKIDNVEKPTIVYPGMARYLS